MRFGSVCSGIEAASVAWHPLGWQAAWLSEIDAAASALLKHRYPDVLNLGDMTAIAELVDLSIVEAPDVLVGGTPCQGFSVAGRRGGLSDPRGQLTLSFVEIADAIDRARRAAGKPESIILWENVPGVLSMRDNAFGNFLAALAGEDVPLEPSGKRWSDAGVVLGPQRAVAWRLLDAQYFGLAQRRKRVFVIASARDGFDPGEVLLEYEGVRRDSPPSRETREDATHAVAPCLTGSGRGIERTGDTRGQDPVVAVDGGGRITNRVSCAARMTAFGEYVEDGTASTIKALDYKDATDLIALEPQCVTGEITHTLKAEGFDASEDGTGRGQPIIGFYPTNRNPEDGNYRDVSPTIKVGSGGGGNPPGIAYATIGFQGRGSNIDLGQDVCAENVDRASGGAPCIAFSAKDHGADATDELSPTLRAGGHSDSHANGGVMPAVAYSVALRGREGGATAELGDDVATCLRTGGGGGDKPHVLAFVQNSRSEVRLMAGDGSVAGALAEETGAQQQTYVATREVAGTITSNYGKQPDSSDTALGPNLAVCNMAVRRLMPVECERLQGFPDGWTRIPVRFYRTQHITDTRPADMWEYGFGPNNQPGWWLMAADGPRYKQLGNSMAVNCMNWLGRRIQGWLELEPFRALIG